MGCIYFVRPNIPNAICPVECKGIVFAAHADKNGGHSKSWLFGIEILNKTKLNLEHYYARNLVKSIQE
jgi:hypothetical protein